MYRRLTLLLTCGVLALALVLTLSSCNEEPTGPGELTEDEPGISTDIHLDEGNIGLVIDARQIVKKGYFPTEAQISFPGYSRFNTSLPIDASTNLAILDIHNTELSEEEKNAFANGVTVNIVIRDATQLELAIYDNILELNDSNTPLSLTTELPKVPPPPLMIKENIPYLLQPEGRVGVITSFCSACYVVGDYVIDNFAQQFYFTLVQGSDTYYISHLGYTEGIYWYFESGNSWVNLRGDSVLSPDEFVLEQDEEGWVRIRHDNTGLYVFQDQSELKFNDIGDRFRLISDVINWQIEDRGTVYHQPIMPPVQLDFAFSSILRNCSSATLEETVGRTESKTRTTTIGTSESLQLFSSESFREEVKVGFEVKAKVGAPVGAGVEITISGEVNMSQEFTTSHTTSSENTWLATKSTTIEVSRIRTLTVLPFTAVEVVDAIKSVENIIVPFTQKLRIRATDTENGTTLSGDEIVTQMLFNFATAVVSDVGSNFVDITIRGNATMTSLFEGFTDVNDLENGCN